MLQRWKLILTNWNNCYFSQNINDEQKINVDSLINIISHLRQNYNLDESKSSVLEAHTIKEFIIEKYPGFEFENGTVEPKTEDEIYMVASLLLFFVCVNSKDVHIKNAMCSKLCSEDQETILKFSKSLLQCSAISYRDVQVAITEACGQDIAAMEVTRRVTVVETPPALRSLHSEVRRLQAALDAERFDRNYLQEELARTNTRVDKLLKEKEQNKLDIVNLKAKISLCCGEESETEGTEADDRSVKLTRQLHELEEKLVGTQEQLDDVIYQRDTYKAKVEELKHERDKWLSLHQEEASRATKLSEELEIERRQCQTLQELLTELRQHNKLNGLDSSSLECDDPETSNLSLHNTSVCSEVCANVVEVQLSEERAKIVVLKQQIQTFQDQINELLKNTEAEKLALKHRINEEIEDKNNLKSHYDDEITKLNNEINELQQTIKDNNDHTRAVIEKKMKEIQTVQEEKLSLLQSFNNEKTKLENVIRDLKTEVDTEKQSKSNMKDSYENHLMKLNEKVLKRNNELVDFQNNICEKSEMIESLQMQLKKEKEACNALGDYCNSLNTQKFAMEKDLKLQLEKINELQNNLQMRNTNIEDLNIEISNLKANITNLNDNCKDLQAIREKLVSEIKDRDGKIEQTLKDIEQIKEEYCKEKEKLILDLDERNETVNSLQIQLKNEIDFKIELQKELSQLHAAKATLTENLEKLESEIMNLKSDVENNEKTIDAMDLYIQEEKKSNELANENIQKMTADISAKENDIKQLNNQLETVNAYLQEETNKKYELLSELEPLHEQVKSMWSDNAELEKGIAIKGQEIKELKDEIEELSQQLDDKDALIQTLEHKFIDECKKYDQFEIKAVGEMTKLTKKINETNNIASECANVLTRDIIEKESLNNKLNTQIENLKGDLLNAEKKIEVFVEKLAQELTYKNLLEENYQIYYSKYENLTTQFNLEIESRNSYIDQLKSDLQILTKSIEEKSEDIKALQKQIKQEAEVKSEMTYQTKTESMKLQKKIVELEALNEEIEQELKKVMDDKDLIIQSLKQENEQLHYVIEEDNSNHELLIKDKDNVIDKLEQTAKDDAIKFNDLHEYSEELKKSWEEYKTLASASLKEKDEEIIANNSEILLLNNNLKHLSSETDTAIAKLKETVSEEATKYKTLHDYCEDLIRSYEDYKNNTTGSLKEKEEEIHKFKTKIILLEQNILQLQEEMNNIKEVKKDLENIINKERAAKVLLQNENKTLKGENKSLLIFNDQLAAKIEKLSQIMTVERRDTKIAEDEKNALLFEKIEIKENLAKNLETVNNLTQDNDRLIQQIIAERNSKENVAKERDDLNNENESLKERIIEDEKVNTELGQKLQILTQSIIKLQQNIENEKKAAAILHGEKTTLSKELDQVEAKNNDLMNENLELVTEKDNLIKQIEEISSAQESLIGERDILTMEKETLANTLKTHTHRVSMLESEKGDLRSRCDILHSEINELQDTCKELYKELQNKQKDDEEIATKLNEIVEERNRFIVENCLVDRTDNVEVEQNSLRAVEDMNKFSQEVNKLLRQNDSLIAILKIEKTTRDEVEAQKIRLEKQFNDLQIQFEEMKINVNVMKETCLKTSEQLRNKEEQFERTYTESKQFQAELNSMKVNTSLISETISNGLDKMLLKFKNHTFDNAVLQKLIEGNDYEDMKLNEKCYLVINIANALTCEIENMKNLQTALKNENLALIDMQKSLKQKEMEIFETRTEVNRLQQIINESRIEVSKQTETYSTSMNSKIKDIQTLQQENRALHNDLNDVKVQLEVKVHSLKEKLVDNENLTDKLKKTYECQIDNLNVMITKLTNYLKDKTIEIDTLRKDKEQLNETIVENRKAIKSLEDEVKTEKQNIDKVITDFDAERQVLKNMVTVTESVMDDQKTSLNNVISEHLKAKEHLQNQVNELTKIVNDTEKKHQAIELAFASILSLLRRERIEKDLVEKESEILRENLDELVNELSVERKRNISVISYLETQNKELVEELEGCKNDIEALQKSNDEMQIIKDSLENEIVTKTDELSKVMQETSGAKEKLEEKIRILSETQTDINKRLINMNEILKEKESLEHDKLELVTKLEALKVKHESNESKQEEEVAKLKIDNLDLVKTVDENKTVIANLEQLIKHELEQNRKLRDDIEDEKLTLVNKCTTLQAYQEKAEKILEEREQQIITLQKDLETLQAKVDICEQDSKAKDGLISKMSKEKDAIISTISKELVEEKVLREKCEKELEYQKTVVHELKNNMEIRALKKENEQLIRAIGQQETFAALCQEKTTDEKYKLEHRDNHQVDNTSSDNTQSSMESLKTITDLEKIIHDKNRTITTLQQDVTYLKSLMAESETKLLDVNKELEVSKENCQQLSSQLKKIVYQKNEEIAELKKQVGKMSVTENRASQIIKVSSKYQAIILRRIAEIKSNTILKELTNFGNTNSCDNDLKRSLNAGTVTMEDLENFLETTDRHIKRCSEKQLLLQKERDRLTEVNRINESEIINLRKFLTELSVSFQTFSSVKDMYAQKLSKLISVQRTIRREILNLDSRITDAAMCKLERGYAAVMQDLAECAMNLERWVERCISRTVSVEKIKQAFISDNDRSSLASPSFQNTGLEIQFEELEKSFQKLYEEVARAQNGDGVKETQASTVMEVRAEYEDKLNRMKAKMKELFNEQMAVFKEKQREEIALLERELQKTRDKMEESKLEYERYIKQLTKELWSVGEKYLVKNDEAEWLKKKQKSGSLMSLQHVHSSGLIPPQEPPSRPSDACSLRSLPVTHNNNTKKREGRQMHMSDEEGEVFDNRWLKELSTPRREPPGQRLSELKWRNSLCPPHLKSSYPAETQFAPVLDEEDLKAGAAGPAKPQRKEVGITAYKKPGPPTPSKQAGRLSATGSELRESLRVENEPQPDRKTSTPARLRNFLRFNKTDNAEGTPRTRRLSNLFRKNR